MKWKQQLHALKPYQPGKPIEEVQKEYGLKEIIKLASNENPYGYSEKVEKALHEGRFPLYLYPDGAASLLRKAVSNHLKVKGNELIFGNGSDNLIQLISKCLLSPATNTVMANPTFSQYRHNAIIEGADIREVPLINGRHDLVGMLSQIDRNTSVVWLCSPNNPSGEYIRESELFAFIEQVPSDVLIVLDEAYYEYVTASDYYDSISLIRKYSNIIILRTFSKIYGLASLRVGYGIASSTIIEKLEPTREPFNVNAIAQLLAIEALNDQQYIKECQEKNKRGLTQFYDFCIEHQLAYYPSEGNFILIDLNIHGDEAFQHFLKKGIIIRSGNALGFPNSIRVTIGTESQNNRFLQELATFLQTRESK